MCVCCLHFQTSSPLKPLGRLKPNFIWSLLGTGERKSFQTVLVIWPRWPSCPYMIKTLKIFFSGTKRPMTLKLGMQHWVLEYYQACSNYNPWLTLTYLTARSNLIPYAFVWEKGKTMDFSETNVHPAGDVTRVSVMPRKVTVKIEDAENRCRGCWDKNQWNRAHIPVRLVLSRVPFKSGV